MQFLFQFPLNTFIGVMGSIGGRFVLSAWNEVNVIKHRGQDNEMGIVSLAYLLCIGGI